MNMHKKKTTQIVFLMLLLTFSYSTAQNNLYLNLTSSGSKSYTFTSLSKITMNESSVVLKLQNGTTESYLYSALSSISFSALTGIESQNGALSICMYPNPASEYIQFSGLNKSTQKLMIYNTAGNLVGIYNVNSTENKLSIGYLQAGMYFIRINNQTIKLSKL